MNHHKLIHELFYSTNKCNRSLAFELSKSTHCHAEVVEGIYMGLLELPSFAAFAKAYEPATVSTDIASEHLSPVAIKQQCLEQFCDVHFNKKMNLNGYHLSGHTDSSLQTLPPILLHCTFLEQLDLSHNDLEQLPEDIGRLHNLKKLNLSSNNAMQGLPASLAKLTKLESLNLSGIFDLFAVKRADGRIGYTVPTVLRALRHLRHLNLQDVMLEKLPEWIKEWQQLESLHLFSGSRQHPLLVLPNSFFQLSQLKTLTIDAFTVSIPEDIHLLHSLESLVVNQAKQVPTTLAQLKRLKYLDLSYLSPNFLLADAPCKHLRELPEDCPTSRLTLFGWEWLLEMTGLEQFIYKHEAPYRFTAADKVLLRATLPACTFSFE